MKRTYYAAEVTDHYSDTVSLKLLEGSMAQDSFYWGNLPVPSEWEINILKAYDTIDPDDNDAMIAIELQFYHDFPPVAGLEDGPGWIGPDGQFYSCGFAGHFEMEFRISYAFYPDDERVDIGRHGWARVDTTSVIPQRNLTQAQLVTLLNLWIVTQTINTTMLEMVLQLNGWQVGNGLCRLIRRPIARLGWLAPDGTYYTGLDAAGFTVGHAILSEQIITRVLRGRGSAFAVANYQTLFMAGWIKVDTLAVDRVRAITPAQRRTLRRLLIEFKRAGDDLVCASIRAELQSEKETA